MKPQTLVLETSSEYGSWALMDAEGNKIDGVKFSGGQKISQALVPSLQENKIEPEKVGNILVGVGPGSFTSIRVAVATALGLARGNGAEIHAVRSSDAIGYRLDRVSFLGVFTDARRNSFFFTVYELGKRSRATVVVPNAELEAYLAKCSLAVTTDGLAGVAQTEHPHAEDLFRAWQKWGPEPDLALEPVYLHPAVVSG